MKKLFHFNFFLTRIFQQFYSISKSPERFKIGKKVLEIMENENLLCPLLIFILPSERIGGSEGMKSHKKYNFFKRDNDSGGWRSDIKEFFSRTLWVSIRKDWIQTSILSDFDLYWNSERLSSLFDFFIKREIFGIFFQNVKILISCLWD